MYSVIFPVHILALFKKRKSKAGKSPPGWEDSQICEVVAGVYTWNLTSMVTLLISVLLNMHRLSCSPECKPDSWRLDGVVAVEECVFSVVFLNVCKTFEALSLRDICYSPSPPVSCLCLSLSLSVMLSSGPAFCPPLFPPWVSIPNMVILLGLYQRPPTPLPYPFSSSCWLYSAGRWVRDIDRKEQQGRRREDSEGRGMRDT